MPGRPFLTAQWKNLVLLNYAVPDSLLVPYLPPGCTLDRWQGRAYVSLVSFEFVDTRVLGIRWPGYVGFPEINLRFYVRHGGRRGVRFIREYVPSRFVAWLARVLYNEPYASGRMNSTFRREASQAYAQYSLETAAGEIKIAIVAEDSAVLPAEDSEAHFFKEHDFGVGQGPAGKTVSYRVHHPVWRVYPVKEVSAKVDWVPLYGESFAQLETREPESVILAEGSEVRVFPKSGEP